jgi:hypothetical protein
MRNLIALVFSALTTWFIWSMITPELELIYMFTLCICCGILVFLVWRWALRPELEKLPKYVRGSWWDTWKY